MNRREFLKATTRSRNTVYVRHFEGTQTGLQPYSGVWTFDEAAHLLRRTMFGAKKSDLDYVLSLGPDEAVNQLLNNTIALSPPVREYGLIEMETGMYDDPNVPQGSTWVNDLNKIEDGDLRAAVFSRRCESLRKWWTGVIINQQLSIQEKMVLFWHHHFSVQKEEVEHPIMLFRHLELLRSHAVGNVRQLTKEVTVDPAMLIHLNGYLNTKVAPDENYARELQELFTVGKGENSLYTEEDVMEAARVLTGWRVDRDTLQVTVDAYGHDAGTKKFSSFYNNTTISGSADAGAELDALMNMIFSNPECGRFICRKLYRWFVNSNIDEDAETNVIEPLAAMFRANNFEIKPVLNTLLKSEHFFDKVNVACYIKSPMDFIAGTLREFDVQMPPYTDYANGYPVFNSVYIASAQMGLDLLQPPDVNGWPAYHQDPMFYEMWINSNSLPRRADFTDQMIEQNVIDVRSFVELCCGDPADPDVLVNDLTKYLLKYPLSASSKLYIKNNFLLQNSADTNEWTTAWNANNNSLIVQRLKNMFRFITNLPEYHLC